MSPRQRCLRASNKLAEGGTIFEMRAIKKKANKKAHEKLMSEAEVEEECKTARRICGVTGGARTGQ